MSYSIDENVTEALQSLGNKSKRITNKALRAGRDYVAEQLQANTPYENRSDRSWKAQREQDKINHTHTTFKHLRDDIVYSGIDQFGHVKIGFGKDTYWRAHFVELGTIYQPARPFISTTIDSTREGYKDIITNELRKGLGL
ncbi:head-tail adaptor protein [Bombilactobacillus bombi]|uniref:Head-tail adaptor protein n=1 Tax=Bombilactobacillus bombi TaxID=1303590 RepID=A0A3R6ZUW3_9LACO|nr:HK97-gp10 family putative phage morphogenesis protein [Bombilactobacillus bombi]RHW46084.1 head-tail adaptor protein [Bombilactobacillus bombi]